MRVNSIFSSIAQDKANELAEYLSACDEQIQTKILQNILQRINPKVLSCLAGDDWLTATQIAERLGVSKQKIGRIANELKLKENPKKSRAYIIQVSKTKYSKIYLYHKSSLNQFKNCLKAK